MLNLATVIGLIKGFLKPLKSGLDGILVDHFDGETATLTNIENTYTYSQNAGHSIGNVTYADGVCTYIVGQNQSSENPYMNHKNLNYGTKKWLIGFKYKINKLNQSVGNYTSFKVLLGTTKTVEESPSWNEWVNFYCVAELDLTRIYLTVYGFATPPVNGDISIQVKDMYLYDVTGLSNALINAIETQQISNYTDGTVTYSIGDTTKAPDTTLSVSGKAADSKAAGDAVHLINETVNCMLVDRFVGNTVTLTNTENVLAFYNGKEGSMASSTNCTYEDGLATFKPLAQATDKSPYVKHSCAKGSGTWLVGFKFRFTKLNSELGNPENFRVFLGQSNITDFTADFGEWKTFSKVATVDLTRIQISARNFETAPTKTDLMLEIKEMYVYNVADVDADMRTYIANKQITDYQDGAATYTIGGDTSTPVIINVQKYGVKGDGATDDTEAIRSLFASTEGTFFFPEGTYKITGTISLPKSSSILGDGDTSVIDMHSCDDLTECEFRGSDKVYPYILITHKNCAVRRIKIIGNDTLQQKRHAGIGVLDTEKCTIEDVTIYNINYDATQDQTAVVSGYGICITRSTLCNVAKCHVQQCGYECIGIVDDCNYCAVRDCYTQDGWRTCIQVHRGSNNTLIENCYMKQTHTKYHAAFTVHGVTDYHVGNLSVNNCTIECTQNGAQPDAENAPAQIMSYTDNTVFTNNRIFGGKRALYIDASSYNAKIIGNELRCNEDSDYGVTIRSHDTIVIGNQLVNEASSPVNNISYNPVLVGNIGISA